MSESTPTPRAMVIMAHPDDPEFFCGGTVAHWAGEGTEMYYCLVTNGNKGTDDRSIAPDQLVAMRIKEQQAAADVLGVRDIVFMGHEDGVVVPDLALRIELTRVIRQYRPDIIICPDPLTLISSGGWINHPDHRAVGLATLDAIFPAARNHNYFPQLLDEGLEPWYVREVYLAGTLNPDAWVDITATLDQKIRAIRCHVSQIRDPDGLEQRIRERGRKADSDPNHPVYVEGFRHLKI